MSYRCKEGEHAGYNMDVAACKEKCATTHGCTHAIHFSDNGCQISTKGCTLVSHEYNAFTDDLSEPPPAPPSPPPSTCESWCKDSNSLWTERCQWAACKACTQCVAPELLSKKWKVYNHRGCGLQWKNNWWNGYDRRERQAVWDCADAVSTTTSGRDDCKTPGSVPGNPADPVWFEGTLEKEGYGTYTRLHGNDGDTYSLAMYTNDGDGRKCGFEWDARQPQLGKSYWHGRDREAKWDCKGNADRLFLKRSSDFKLQSDPNIFGGASFYRFQIRAVGKTECGLVPGAYPSSYGLFGGKDEYQAYWDCNGEYKDPRSISGVAVNICPTAQAINVDEDNGDLPCGYLGEGTQKLAERRFWRPASKKKNPLESFFYLFPA